MKHMFRHGIITKADFLLIAAVLIAASVIIAVRTAGRTEMKIFLSLKRKVYG